MKRRMLSIVAGLCAVFASTPTLAGTQYGTVQAITIRADGLVYFTLTGTASGRAACASGTNYWMIKAENTEAGKRQLALLLTARAAGLVITVTGSGTCTRYPDGEDAETLAG